MGRRPHRAAPAISPPPSPLRESRRARAEFAFEDQSLLVPLFGQFDANLVQVENRLGVFISARGDKVQIEGPEDSVARARDVIQTMYDRLARGQDLDSGAIESLIMMSNEPTLEGIIAGDDGPPIMIRTRRKTIVPRSAGQIPYMRQLAHDEIIFSLGSVPIAEYATPSTQELPDAVKKYITAHDGLLLANHGALTAGQDLMNAYFKMETMEHFAQITLVARQLGRENLISREEVDRLQGLRDFYGIKSPAPICTDPARAADGAASCQFVDAPASDGPRLVASPVQAPWASAVSPGAGEIRLTYRELAALIADAVRQVTRDA